MCLSILYYNTRDLVTNYLIFSHPKTKPEISVKLSTETVAEN